MNTAILARPAIALAALLALATAFAAPAPPEKVAFLGVVTAPVDDTLRHQLKLGRGVGLQVDNVQADSPAAKAGVMPHDIIEKLNEQLLFNQAQLAGLVRSYSPGEKVTVGLVRQGEREKLEITLGETKLSDTSKSLILLWDLAEGGPRHRMLFDRVLEMGSGHAGAVVSGKPSAYLGVELAPVEAALATQLGLEEAVGALVTLVLDDSPAAKAGLKAHDVIAKLDGKPVKDPADLSSRIRDHKQGDKVTLAIIRASKSVEIEATLSEKAAADPTRLRKLSEEYRVVPRVRVLRGAAESDDVVVHLESDGSTGGEKVERRVIVRATEPGEPVEGRSVTRESRSSDKSVSEHKFMVIKTDEGVTTTVKVADGKRQVSVKDAQGKVIFEGPVNSAEEKQKLPPEVREHLDKLDQKLETDPGSKGEDVIRELRLPPVPTVPDAI